jgi:hypothetical protein
MRAGWSASDNGIALAKRSYRGAGAGIALAKRSHTSGNGWIALAPTKWDRSERSVYADRGSTTGARHDDNIQITTVQADDLDRGTGAGLAREA